MPENLYQIVLTTCPDRGVAEKLASSLVEAGLAACVNVLPAMQSFYTWRGKTENATEHLLVIKGQSSRYGEIQAKILALHPYELPEIIAVPIANGLPAYLAWLDNPKQDR